jgi:3-methyladenine DNA glycosylase AlkC
VKAVEEDKSKFSEKGLKHHLDNIEHSTMMYKAYGFKSHADSLEWSKEVIIEQFRYLKAKVEEK